VYLTRGKQHRATRRFIRESHAALLAGLLADTVGRLITYSEAHTSPSQHWPDADILEA